MESSFANGMASNGVFGVVCLIGYVIYKKCNSNCHYDSTSGWRVDIGGESDDEEDKNIDKIFELLKKQKSLKKLKKSDSRENIPTEV